MLNVIDHSGLKSWFLHTVEECLSLPATLEEWNIFLFLLLSPGFISACMVVTAGKKGRLNKFTLLHLYCMLCQFSVIPCT